MASKELQVALRLLAKTNEFQAEIARASKSVADLGSNAQSASEEAASGFEAAEESADGLTGKIQSAIDSVIAFAAGFVAVQTAVDALDLADALNGANDNLAIAVHGSVDLANAQKLVFEAAQASSGELVGSTKLAATLFKSFETGGVLAEEALTRSTDLVRIINEGLALGGGAAEANQNALQQLVQGIQSGTFAGDELKSVLEQSPPLAEALAKGMGKSVGELKALGAAGKISGTDVINALEKSAAEIDKNFETLGGNAGRGLQRGLNSVQLSLGALFRDNGIDAAVELALAEAGTGIATFIDQSRALFTDFTSALKNLFGDDQIFSGLGASALEVFGYISRGVFGIVGGARDAFSLFIASGDLAFTTVKAMADGYVTGSIIAFKNIELRYVQVWDVLVATADAGYRKIRTLGGLLGDDTPVQSIVSARATALQAELKLLATSYNARAQIADQQKDQALAEIQYTLEHGYSVEQIIKSDTKRSNSHTELTAKLIAETKAQTAAVKKAESERVKAILDAADLQLAAFGDVQKANEDLINIAQSLAEELGGPAAKANAEYTRTMLEIESAYQLILKNGPATEAQIQANTQARIDAKTRLDKVLADNDPILKAAKAASENWSRYWGDAIGDVADTFSDWLVNGAGSFKDFGKELLNIAKNIVADLISTFIKSKITVPIQAAISNVGSGGLGELFSSFFGGGGPGKLGKGGPADALGQIGSLGGGSAAYAIPVAGWIAAAIAVSSQLYASGWKPQGGTVNFGNGGMYSGGGLDTRGRVLTQLAGGGLGERLFTALGVNNRLASILSGAPIFTALFGRKAPEIQSQGVNLTVGQGSAIGNIFANILEKGGLFRSDRRSVRTTGLTPELQADANAVSAQTRQIVRAALGGLATDLQTTITGSFQSLTDKTGKVIEESITVLGVKYKEGLELLPARVGAENIFASLAVITSQSLESFAAQFRAGAEGLLDAAVTAATAQQLIAEGAGLLKTGDLLSTVNLVNELKVEGEKLTDALTRVYGSAELLSQATRIMGIAISQSEADIVRFAVNISDSAGGLDQATGLFDRFFQVAFTDAERGLAQLTAAETRRNALLDQAGLSGETTLATLRSAIEDLLKTGADPARLVLLLQAADAIADVSDVIAALGETSTQSSLSIEALKVAISELDKFTDDLNARFVELSRSGLTDFERQILGINDQLLVDVATLQRTRAEMVRRGATTEQLARIDRELARAHSFAAQAAAQAISLLRRQGQSLVAQLRKNLSDNVQELANTSSGAFQQITEAANDTYAAQLAGLKSIKEYLDSQLLGDLSSLTPAQRFAEAQAQFNAALSAAPNDPTALARLTQLADTLLRETRAFRPSNFPEIEAQIRAALAGLVNAGPIGNPTVSNPGGFGSDGVSNAIDNSANEFGASQAELALQIAEVMRQLGEATGDTLAEVAASIGVNVGELVTALGISLTELTAASTQQLAALAASLGVELSELASNVGVELGTLANRQSLLNDAVEAEIAALPESQRIQLQALFDAVQNAADDPAGLVIAEKNLSDAIKAIGGDTQNVLAPYFADIDPTNPLADINTTLNGGFAGVIDAVNNINIRNGQPVPPEGSFAVGTAFVPRDMLAQIHQGEAVIDAGTMQALRRYGIPLTGGVAANSDNGVNQDMLAELRAMRTELAQLRATVATGDADNVKATARAAKVQADAIESTRAARTGRLVGSY